MAHQNSRWYELTIASGGTTSNSAVIYGGSERLSVVLSGVTSWNAGSGNSRVFLQGKVHPDSTNWSDFPGASALTEVGGSRAYDFGVCPPFEAIRLSVGTSTTSVATFYVGLLDYNS